MTNDFSNHKLGANAQIGKTTSWRGRRGGYADIVQELIRPAGRNHSGGADLIAQAKSRRVAPTSPIKHRCPMTRIAIIQSNYVPWRGYFDLMDDCDIFIIFDDVQYTDRDWRNRNRLKTPRGLEWISVSVTHTSRDQLIQNVPIDWDADWASRHLNVIRQNYREAPWYSEIANEFSEILARKPRMLSELNVTLMTWIMARCGIKTQLINASALPSAGRKTERLISLVKGVGGATYVSGPAAESYLDVDAFRRAGLGLEYKTYDYEPYRQLWGPFEGAVSILDLLMNTGPNARQYLKSRSPNRHVV